MFGVFGLLLPYAIYLLMKSRSDNSESFMRKRNVQMYYAVNSSLILVIISSLYLIFAYVHSPNNWLFLLGIILWSTSVFVWISLLATRNWLIYFRYKWTYYVSLSKWQQIINPNVLNDDLYTARNWFIANYDKYGQFKYTSRLFGKLSLFCTAFFISSLVIMALWTVETLGLILSSICALMYGSWTV